MTFLHYCAILITNIPDLSQIASKFTNRRKIIQNAEKKSIFVFSVKSSHLLYH